MQSGPRHVSFGMHLQKSPWGGGNQAISALSAYLEERGLAVGFDLERDDFDFVVLTDPRRELQSCSYSPAEIFRYRRLHPQTLVIHRVNECDERKGTHHLNRLLLRANLCADFTVFVSDWLRDLFLRAGLPCRRSCVIRNGSDRRIFHANGHVPWQGDGPLRIVTHHWSSHAMKGFDIYARLDDLLATTPSFRERFSFTYIGNVPEGFSFRAARYVSPTHGEHLGDLLRAHDVYLTASRNEPGGNHQNEGASCGLPLLYLNSGCMPEYCEGFGIAYEGSTLVAKVEEMRRDYSQYAQRMMAYPNTAERMGQRWYDLFATLYMRKDEILSHRRGAWERLWRWRLGARLLFWLSQRKSTDDDSWVPA
jgi:hypothetical protein